MAIDTKQNSLQDTKRTEFHMKGSIIQIHPIKFFLSCPFKTHHWGIILQRIAEQYMYIIYLGKIDYQFMFNTSSLYCTNQ